MRVRGPAPRPVAIPHDGCRAARMNRGRPPASLLACRIPLLPSGLTRSARARSPDASGSLESSLFPGAGGTAAGASGAQLALVGRAGDRRRERHVAHALEQLGDGRRLGHDLAGRQRAAGSDRVRIRSSI